MSRMQRPIARFIYSSEEMQYCQFPAPLTPLLHWWSGLTQPHAATANNLFCKQGLIYHHYIIFYYH